MFRQKPTPTQMLLELAIKFGIGWEVSDLLLGRKPQPIPSLAKLLCRQRKRLGVTAKQLSQESGLSLSHIVQMENGKHIGIGIRTAKSLAIAYELDIEEVLLSAILDYQNEPGSQELPKTRHPL